MGNSVADSMRIGIPIILRNTGYIAEKASKSFPEIVSPSNNAKDLAETISNVICKKNVISRYQDFYDEFFLSTNVDTILKSWIDLLGERQQNQKKDLPSGILSVVLHDVDGELHDSITTPISVFTQFVEDIYHSGRRLCSMRDYLSMNETERKYYIVCTFDDGYKGVLENALPSMKRYGFTATVYVCTEYIGKYNDWNYKDRQRRIHLDYAELHALAREGWEIGSHGVTHRSLLRLSDEEVIYELSHSKQILEEEFGPITSYAYPYGDYNDYIMKIVKQLDGNAVLLTKGGVFLEVDSYRIYRYDVSAIYKSIKGL